MMEGNRRLKFLYRLGGFLKCHFEDLQKLSVEQATYINMYTGKSTFLEACPGSGKTEVIGLKCAYDISRWKNNLGGIAVITFTNSAADELSIRVRKYAQLSSGLYPHYIGTFDSWLHGFIFQPFAPHLVKYAGKNGDKSIRIIEDDLHADFLGNYTTLINQIPVRATDYHFATDGTLAGNSEQAERLLANGITEQQTGELRRKKTAFLRAGFATYSDAEIISKIVLDRHEWLCEKLSRRFPIIIVDECQDLSQSQIAILEKLREKGTTLHLVGDMNQSIYEFRKVNPQEIRDYVNAQPFEKFRLTNNYRSNQSIVNVSQAIIGSPGEINASLNAISEAPCVIWQYTAQTYAQLPERFERLITSEHLDLKKCAILARGKSTLLPLRAQSDKARLGKAELFAMALDCWHKPVKNTDDIGHALFYIGRAFCLLAYSGRGNAQQQYCPESFEAIEWRLLLKRFLNSSIALYPFEENGRDLNWRQWITKLKGFLSTFWPTLTGRTSEYNAIANKLRSPDGQTNNPVKDICNNVGVHNLIRTTTIHSVKGETLDAVMLVSHKDRVSKGGHYSHWLREGNFVEEHLRFAYVACSRPRQLLVIATPTLSDAELLKFRNLGFA